MTTADEQRAEAPPPAPTGGEVLSKCIEAIAGLSEKEQRRVLAALGTYFEHRVMR